MKKPSTKVKKKGILLQINPDAHKALKLLAVEEERAMSSLAVEALNDLLKKRGIKARVIDYSKQ